MSLEISNISQIRRTKQLIKCVLTILLGFCPTALTIESRYSDFQQMSENQIISFNKGFRNLDPAISPAVGEKLVSLNQNEFAFSQWNQNTPSIAYLSNPIYAIIAWSGFSNASSLNSEIYFNIINIETGIIESQTIMVSNQTNISGNQLYPSVAIKSSDNQSLIVWQASLNTGQAEICGCFYDISNPSLPILQKFLQISNRAGSGFIGNKQENPQAISQDVTQRFFVTWSGIGNSSTSSVYGIFLYSNGTIEDPFEISNESYLFNYEQTGPLPLIFNNSNSLVIVWNGENSTSPIGTAQIYAKIYQISMISTVNITPSILISDNFTISQYYNSNPAIVSINYTQSFIILWVPHNFAQLGGIDIILTQFYPNNLSVIQIPINILEPGNSYNFGHVFSIIAANIDSLSSIVVCWNGFTNKSTTSTVQIYFRIFNYSTGQYIPNFEPVQVSPNFEQQVTPSIAVNGNQQIFSVSWSENSTTYPNISQIYVKTYSYPICDSNQFCFQNNTSNPICSLLNSCKCAPCINNSECTSTYPGTPYCRMDGSCVLCISNQNCSSPIPCCLNQQECVQCIQNQDCQNASIPICSSNHFCVQCISNSDCPTNNPFCNNTECYPSPEDPITATITQVAGGIAGFTAASQLTMSLATSQGNASFARIAALLQTLYCLLLLNLNYPENLANFLKFFKVVTLQSFPNPLNFFIPKDEVIPIAPLRFQNQGLTGVFLQDVGQLLFLYAILLVLHFTLFIARKTFRNKRQVIMKIIYVFGIPRVELMAYSTSLVLFTSILTQLMFSQFNSTVENVSFVFAFMILVAFWAFAMRLFKVINWVKRRRKNNVFFEWFMGRYEYLFDGLINQGKKSVTSFVLCVMFKNFGSILSILVLYKWPGLQIAGLILFSIFLCFYIFNERPMVDNHENILSLILQVLMTFVYVLILTLIGNEDEQIGWVIICVILIMLSVLLVLTIFDLVKTTRLLLSRKNSKIKNEDFSEEKATNTMDLKGPRSIKRSKGKKLEGRTIFTHRSR